MSKKKSQHIKNILMKHGGNFVWMWKYLFKGMDWPPNVSFPLTYNLDNINYSESPIKYV